MKRMMIITKTKSSWNSRLPFVWDLIVLKFNQLESSPNEDDDIDAVPTSETSKREKRKTHQRNHPKRLKLNRNTFQLKNFGKLLLMKLYFLKNHHMNVNIGDLKFLKNL